jgi:hypothetical protein
MSPLHDTRDAYHLIDCDYCMGIMDLYDIIDLRCDKSDDDEVVHINNVPYISLITISKIVDEITT